MSQYPISERCPQCGGREHEKRKPDAVVAFAADRVCKACQTRYTPPTPAWAAVVLLLVGLLFASVGILAFVALFVLPDGGFWSGVRTYIVVAFTLPLGIAAVVHGVRSLAGKGKGLTTAPEGPRL
jgi:hypothetical protein